MQHQRFKKFSRDPEAAKALSNRQITERALSIIAAIERYRVIPTSLLLRLVGGDRRNIYGHLQHLYHRGLINRFCFFGPTGRPQEFNYFVDNQEALELLIDRTRVDPNSLDFEQVKRNRDNWTPALGSQTELMREAVDSEEAQGSSEGQRLFLKHELMISRFHGMLELAALGSGGRVKLVAWYQGPILHRSIEAPKMTYRGGEWHQEEGTERIPHRPDALFTIQTHDDSDPRHFFYEADRKRTNTTRMIKKLRGHFHYIAKAKQHRTDYGIQRIRAVLTETLDTNWAETLRIAAQHPVVSGPKPSELFWFTASQLFTKPIPNDGKQNATPRSPAQYHLAHPELIFRPLWFAPVDTQGSKPRSLLD